MIIKRELYVKRCGCASGTTLNDGAAILRAVCLQQRGANWREREIERLEAALEEALEDAEGLRGDLAQEQVARQELEDRVADLEADLEANLESEAET